MEQRDPYSVLGVNRDASEVEIRKAYHKLARLIHPDKFDRNQEPRAWEDAHEVFKAITEAYSLLRDPERRSKLDRDHGKSRNSQPPQKPARPKRPRNSRTSQEKPKTRRAPEIKAIKSGSVSFDKLHPTTERRLVNRQKGLQRDQVSLSTGSIKGSILWTTILILWFPGLALFKSGQQWNGWTVLWTLGASLFLATLSIKSIRDILSNISSPLRSRIYVTPLYIISTSAREVSWWPLYLLRDFDVAHHYRGDTYTHSTLLLDVLESRVSFSFSSDPVSKIERFVEALQKQHDLFMSAAQSSNWKYFTENDDFAELTQSSTPRKKSFFSILSSISSFIIFLGCWGILFSASNVTTSSSNTSSSNTSSSNTSSSNTSSSNILDSDPLVPKSNSTITRQDTFNSTQDFFDKWASLKKDSTAIPTQPILNQVKLDEYNNNINDRGAAILPPPENGETRQHSSLRPIAPLKISTRGKMYHYFIKLMDPSTDMPITTVFIRAGQTASVKVPIGKWEMRYATGIQWRGEEELFGSEQTSYYRADTLFTFFAGFDQVYGHSVELFEQENGNLTQTAISPEEW